MVVGLRYLSAALLGDDFVSRPRVVPNQTELEQRLTSLVRLPWFRYGALPDWLRLRLISSLPPAAEASVRETLEKLFLTMMQQPAGGLRLEIATETQPSMFERFKQRLAALKFKLMFRQYLRNQPPESPLRDYVFLSFMAKRTPRKLSVSLPDTIRRMLFPQGQRALGFRPATALLLAIILSLSVFFINRRVTAGGNTQPPAVRFYSDMTAPEQLQFVEQKMQEFLKAMDGADIKFEQTVDGPAYIKQLMDVYVGRIGNRSTSAENEDLTFVLGRGVSEVAPAINKAFRDRGVSPLIGLYIAMTQSGYNPNANDGKRDAAGLFGLSAIKAREIGLDPADRFNRAKVIAQVASFAQQVQNQFSELSALDALSNSIRVDLQRGALRVVAVRDAAPIADQVLAAGIIGENPRTFRLDMNPVSTYTTITTENSTEIAYLVGRLGEIDRRAASARLVDLYQDNKSAVVQALIDAIQLDSSSSYRPNLYIAVTLGSIRPNWDGTADQFARFLALQKTSDYQDSTFKSWVDKAIDNFNVAAFIDCDCAHVDAGLLTQAYRNQCQKAEYQLKQQFKQTGVVYGQCDSTAFGPNAKPKESSTPSATTVSSPPATETPSDPRNIAVSLVASATNVQVGDTVTFRARMNSSESFYYDFDFGDGTRVGPVANFGGARVGADTTVQHTYSSAGVYKASVTGSTIPRGRLGAIPLSGSSSIAIVVNASALGQIPSLIGKQEPDVRNMFNPKMEFVLGNVSYKDDAAHQSGTVLSQSPVAGTRAPNGTKIDIVVAKSPQAADDVVEMIVPNVVGMSVTEATRTLEQAGFKPQIDYANGASSQGGYFVVSQKPAGLTRIRDHRQSQNAYVVNLVACPNAQCK